MANPSTVFLIAREVYLNRNARGAPSKHRARMKAAIRPLLRHALAAAHGARDAYRAGEISTGNTSLMLARHWVQKAQLEGVMAVAGSRAEVWASSASSRKKLTASQELRAVERVKSGTPQKTVAAELGVSEKTISRLLKSCRK